MCNGNCCQNYNSLPGKPISIWKDTTSKTNFSEYIESKDVYDVVIVGGGIVGITCTYFLSNKNLKVGLIESGRIVEGVTGNTTAKITSQHNLIYQHINAKYGESWAKIYGNANEEAIKKITEISEKEDINCDFIKQDAFTYAESEDTLEKIKEEVKVTKSLGLPAEFVKDLPLPIKYLGAIKFSNQAKFHPRKFLLGLTKKIKEPSVIFENTKAVDIKEDEVCEVITEKGIIKGKNVIVATHFPFYDKGMYFSRLFPKRSYVLGMTLKGKVPDGMHISAEDQMHSFRSQKTYDGEVFFVGGENHKTGQGGNVIQRFKNLENYAQENFKVKEIIYRWATQDNVTIDQIPYIGLHVPSSKNVYVATGFGGWGMTSGVVAAMLLTDLITGVKNSWQDVFNPNRTKQIKATGKYLKENINVAKYLIGGFSKGFLSDIEKLKKCEGEIINDGLKKVAVYRDDKGKLFKMSAVCTHMGCIVNWNNGEKSWDCPCHGSRFDYDGKVLHGPALENLKRI